jgi:hypothetical protein
MNFLNRKIFLTIALTATGLLVAIAWSNQNAKVLKMTNAIQALPMKTLCIGRFLLDVPQKAVVSYGKSSLAGWDISSWKEAETLFDMAQEKALVSLKTQKNSQGELSFDSVRDIRHGDLHGRILVFNRKRLERYVDDAKTVEYFVSVRASVHSQSNTYEFYSEIATDRDIDDLEKILKQITWRAENQIPEQAGFCFNGGLLGEPLSSSQAEFTGVFIGLESNPDLAISLHSLAGIEPGKTLLQRDAANGIKLQYFSRFHTLREGSRILNGIAGEEILERVDEPNGSTLQSFMWESLSKKDDVYLPNLILEFSTGHGKPGGRINSSMSDAEALALWEKISGSLRRRPAQPVKPASAVQKGT